jgi:hypothetical protein
LPDREKDHDLRGLFRRLREEDGEKVPEFGALMARAREEAARSGMEAPPVRGAIRRFNRRLAWGGSLLAAAAAVALLLGRIPGTSDSEFVQVVQAYTSNPASGAWKSPTQSLLHLPGTKVLSTVPSLGTKPLLMDARPALRRNEL